MILTPLLAFAVITWSGFTYLEKVNLHSLAITAVHNVFHGKFDTLVSGQVPSNVQDRIEMWNLYTQEIVSTHKTHAARNEGKSPQLVP
jgi:hypothetical protein